MGDCFGNVSQHEFEEAVCAAYERSWEEQRCSPLMYEAAHELGDGPKAKKKIMAAAEEGFKRARKPSGMYPNVVQDFVAQFINETIRALSETSQGEPQWVMAQPVAVKFFNQCLETGCCPLSLVEKGGAPPAGDPFVDTCINDAYAAHVVDNSSWQSKKKRRTGGDDWDGGGEWGEDMMAMLMAAKGKMKGMKGDSTGGWGGKKGGKGGKEGKDFKGKGKQTDPMEEFAMESNGW